MDLDHNFAEILSKTDLKENLKNSVITDKKSSLREIFDEITSNHKNWCDIGFGEVENLMFRQRQKEFGNIPQTIQNLAKFFSDPNNKVLKYKNGHSTDFYRALVEDQSGTFILCSSNKQLQALVLAETISIDATFKVVPRSPKLNDGMNFYQLLVICAKI